MSSLASGLVALGFSSSSPRAFASLAFTVLPTVFVLGWFTIARLTDTSVANIVSLRRMELIRAYYAALAPMAPPYFGAGDSPARQHGVRYGRWSFLFTMASMVITVNCVLGGAAIGASNPASGPFRANARSSIIEMAASGNLTVPLARAFAFEDARDAVATLAGPHPSGKLALVLGI